MKKLSLKGHQDSIEWFKFKKKICAYFGISQEKYYLEFECLRHLLSAYDKEYPIITVELFQRFLNWFGPLSPSNSNFPFEFSSSVDSVLKYIKNLYEKKWWFGFLSKEEATQKLGSCKDGSYLVRTSGEPGSFTLQLRIDSFSI